MFNKKDREELTLIKEKVSSLINNDYSKYSISILDNTIDKLKDENARLTNIINQIINLTFDNDDSNFEIVVFQRYEKEPIIYHKGEKINLDNMSKVNIEFVKKILGECNSYIKVDLA